MKIVDFTDLADLNFAVTDISVIYQTPQWNTLGKRNKPRTLNGFLLVDQGECRYDWDRDSATLQAGSLIYLPRGSRKMVTVTARPFSFYRICFNITDLADGECTVSEIAEMLGFESAYYFSRTFKQYTGTSPSHYINEK